MGFPMTKAFYERPNKEIRFVKPGNDDVYEYYILEPRLIGTLTKHGNQRITTDDGAGPFSHHAAALRHLLHRAGEDATLGDKVWISSTKPKKNRVHAVTGIQLAMRGKWNDFCALLKIDATDEAAAKKLYKIKEEDMRTLGLEDLIK